MRQICMWCKKGIAGEKSDPEISTGICCGCRGKHFPQVKGRMKNTGVGWSARVEKACTIVGGFGAGAFAGGILIAIFTNLYRAAFLSVFIGIVFFAFGFYVYQEMDRNRPANGAKHLTNFTAVRSDNLRVLCDCGSITTWRESMWFPNYYDAGGGRFAFVCRCGRGYYRLKNETEVPQSHFTKGIAL